MATIQIRDVPSEAYEAIRGRAQRRGLSLQAYMLESVTTLAAQPDKAEVAARVAFELSQHGGLGLSRDEIVAGLDSDRR